MPQPGIASDIKKLIEQIAANDRKPSAKWIAQRMRLQMPGRDLPSERTIGRVKEAFLNLPEEVQRPFRYLSWPEAMLDHSLPWSAAPLMRELLFYYRKREYSPPTIAMAVWFWRISLAARDLEVARRVDLAKYCASLDPDAEKSEWERGFRAIEAYLMAAPWESEKNSKAYQARIKAKEIYALPSEKTEEIPQLRKLRRGGRRSRTLPGAIEVRSKIPPFTKRQDTQQEKDFYVAMKAKLLTHSKQKPRKIKKGKKDDLPKR